MAATVPRAVPADLSHAWRALRHRNFRLLFGGQSISLICTWMTRLATAWLVYRLTKSSLLLIAGTAWFWTQLRAIRTEIRPIYERLGIIPPPNPPIAQQAGD